MPVIKWSAPGWSHIASSETGVIGDGGPLIFAETFIKAAHLAGARRKAKSMTHIRSTSAQRRRSRSKTAGRLPMAFGNNGAGRVVCSFIQESSTNHRTGYERKRSQINTKTMGHQALDETESRDWRVYRPEERPGIQVGFAGKRASRRIPSFEIPSLTIPR